MRQRFYNTISRHPWFRASAGHIFETHVLLWLRYAPAQECLPCTRAVDSSPLLEIPACGKNMEFFARVEDLKNVGEPESQKCLVPVAQNFPTLDAVILTHKFVITIQITVGSTHDAKSTGFEKVYKWLPSDFLANRRWCHVFLTDAEDKADSLRGQKLNSVPEGMTIHVYSAFMNVDQCGSILTSPRVEELNMVWRYWLRVSDIDLIGKCTGTGSSKETGYSSGGYNKQYLRDRHGNHVYRPPTARRQPQTTAGAFSGIR
jgi:hypothetical protein